jgi:hypothetical protein
VKISDSMFIPVLRISEHILKLPYSIIERAVFSEILIKFVFLRYG